MSIYTMNRNEIMSILEESICLVEFTKVNGEQRIMKCTLMSDKLPMKPIHPAETRHPELLNTEEKKENTKVISVFDMEKNDWRSFRVDLFKSIEKVT